MAETICTPVFPGPSDTLLVAANRFGWDGTAEPVRDRHAEAAELVARLTAGDDGQDGAT